jgi:hypothetical protein
MCPTLSSFLSSGVPVSHYNVSRAYIGRPALGTVYPYRSFGKPVGHRDTGTRNSEWIDRIENVSLKERVCEIRRALGVTNYESNTTA